MDIYQTFEPTTYLNDYYRTIAPDSHQQLRFLVAAFASVPNGVRVLDFGGGPTLFTALAAARRATEIHVSDYSPANRAAVRAWVHAEAAAFDWRHFTAEVLRLEGEVISAAAIATREALVRARLTAVLACDAAAHPALMHERAAHAEFASPAIPAAYDVVCSSMCLEAVASDAAEWERYLGNLVPLVRPGGRLLLTTVRRCAGYLVGEQLYPVAQVDEQQIRAALIRAGFVADQIIQQIVPSNHPVHPYEGLVLTDATAGS